MKEILEILKECEIESIIEFRNASKTEEQLEKYIIKAIVIYHTLKSVMPDSIKELDDFLSRNKSTRD